MLIYADDKYKILKDGRNYTLININGEQKNHSHLHKQDTCFLLIRLIEKQVVPKSKYLREEH